MAKRESVQGMRGRLAVALDSASYAPGEIVSGIVTLSIVELVQAKEPLSVLIQGREDVAWDDGGDTPVGNAFDKAFLQHKIVLTPTSVCAPGHSEYRFDFQLPAGLPSSFDLSNVYSGNVERLRVQLNYQVSVWLRADSESVAYMQAEQEFTVHAPPTIIPPARSLEMSTSAMVQWLWCIKRGSVEMTIQVPKDVFVAGGIVSIQCQLDGSACKTAIASLSVDLVEDIVLRNLGERLQWTVTRVLSTQQVSGPSAGQTLDMVVNVPLTESEKQTPLNPTLATHFFRCTHRLVVRCQPFMAQAVDAEVALKVLHRNTPSSATITQLQMPS